MGKTLMHILKSSFRLYKIDEVDDYYRSNPYILTGYRGNLHWTDCVRSVFSFHNETLNIWTHLLGFVYFAGIFIRDIMYVPSFPYADKAAFSDFAIWIAIIICYQATMILSALFHTFTCHSQKVSESCLSLDMLGIALCLLATYLSGMYYAFYCHPFWQNFYLLTVGGLFLSAAGLQLWPKFSSREYSFLRVGLLTVWAAYGLLPTLHWVSLNEGPDDKVIPYIVPRILTMYGFCGIAFFFYVSKIPERVFPGVTDILGHSHQWWHAFIFIALSYWHNTGMLFATFRIRHGCSPVTEEDVHHLKYWPFQS